MSQLSTFRKPRRDRGRRRRRRAMLRGAALGTVGTAAVIGGGALLYRHGQNFRSGMRAGRMLERTSNKTSRMFDRATSKVRTLKQVYDDPGKVMSQVQKIADIKAVVNQGMARDRRARQAVGNAIRRVRSSVGFAGAAPVVEFARRKHLSASHKRKISRSLRNRKKPVSLKERGLRVREAEARARGVRNVGYVTNAVTQGVREARMTARFLGVAPRTRSANSYRSLMKDVGLGVSTARGVTRLLRI